MLDTSPDTVDLNMKQRTTSRASHAIENRSAVIRITASSALVRNHSSSSVRHGRPASRIVAKMRSR